MNSDSTPHQPLAGDPGRQAVPSLRGYAYQMWRTIERWLSLKPGETLFIECAEDFDIATANGTTTVQVKNKKGKLSLAGKDAGDAILHFWQLRESSPTEVRFQFLTSASIATERSAILSNRPGIVLWKEAAAGNLESAELLRKFLIEKFASQADLKSYLEARTSEQLIVEWYRRFEWVTEEPDAEIIQEFIRRRLIDHGHQQGCSPSVSARVVNDLYSHCWKVAQRQLPKARSLTREDFLLIFEKATSVLVPWNVLSGLLLPSNTTGSSVRVAGSIRFWTRGVPPLPEPTLTREQAVKTALAHLSTVPLLVLAGSVGKGKTTLAKLITLAFGKDCLWVDLSGRDMPFVDAALAAVALALEDRPESTLVVIDDFPAEPGSPQVVWTSFGMLQRACENSGSALLVTTKGIPQERLDARLISAAPNVQQIENLSNEEIKQFFEMLGCPSSMSTVWATVTLAQTGGHPKLVHVRALDLRDQGWPRPSVQVLTETPVSISGQRENERLNVAQRETGRRLEFLYHLTLLTLPFDRKFAIRLGSKMGLQDPGTVLDSFLGRWIEPFVASHFRITSLLSNEATKVWLPEKIREAHATIFDSFLEGRVIDITHAFSILMHAYLSQSSARLARYIKGLVDNRDDHFPQIASELRIITHFNSGVGNRVVPIDANVSLMFRLLQFRVASREAPSELDRIANEWLWEIENLPKSGPGKDEEYRALVKALWAGSIASNTGSDLSPQIIVDAIVTLDALNAFDKMASAPAALRNKSGSDDMVAVLFSFFQIRCRDIDYLDPLVDALTRVPDRLRSRMLAAAELPIVAPYGFLAESAWIGEFRKENPDWTKTVDVLERTKTRAKEWGAARLGLSASKAQSIIFDEHLNNREAARAALEEGAKLFGPSPALDDQLANIHYGHGELEAALAIWQNSLAVRKDASENLIRDPFSFRKAAIAAGKGGDFARAGGLFVMGSHWAQEAGLSHTASALLFDAAYAFYKARKLKQMCDAMRNGLDELMGEPDPDADFNRFALQKLAGHVVLWIRNEVTTGDKNQQAEPILGYCSTPDYDSAIKQLTRSPAELTIGHVVEVEHRVGLPPTTRSQFASTLEASRIPALEMLLASVDLENVYRHQRFDDLFHALEAMTTSLERARAQRRLRRDMLGPFLDEVEPQDRVQLPTEHFLVAALTVHLLSGRGGAESLIGAWKERSERSFSGTYSRAIDNLAGAVAQVSESARVVLIDAHHGPFVRLVAAHVVLASPPKDPGLTAYAQVAYITWLFQTDVRMLLREIVPVISASFARSWTHHVSQPALLLNPRLTIPDIQAALGHPSEGPKKLRQILVAASAATGVRIPPQVLDWLDEIDVDLNEKENQKPLGH